MMCIQIFNRLYSQLNNGPSNQADLLNAKIFLILCGIAGILYLIWPYLMWMVKVFIYNLILDYGFYILILLAGGGYYLWRRLKS